MPLPEPVLTYLNRVARRAGIVPLTDDRDLFTEGVLDSFSLVDFLNVLEENSGIEVPDADVLPANFRTIAEIDRYPTEQQRRSQ